MINENLRFFPSDAGGVKVHHMHDMPPGLTMKRIREVGKEWATNSGLQFKAKKVRGRNLLLIRMSFVPWLMDDFSFADGVKGCQCEACDRWYKESGK